MTSLAMLLYASSSWWGFTSAQDRQRLESMVRRMIRWGFWRVMQPPLNFWQIPPESKTHVIQPQAPGPRLRGA